MIAGINPQSFVDVPDQIAYSIFTQGCNMKCPWCHNKGLWSKKEGKYSEEYILDDIKSREDFISWVCISGGEPLLWQDRLINFINTIKEETNLKVKLDTNGSLPETLSLANIDYIAMDIKLPLFHTTKKEIISRTIGVYSNTIINDLKRSLTIIEDMDINKELRITWHPYINKPLMDSIVNSIEKYIHNDKFTVYIQQFRTPENEGTITFHPTSETLLVYIESTPMKGRIWTETIYRK